MPLEALCPDPATWRICKIAPEQDRIVLHLEPLRTPVACPGCGTSSRRIQSRYRRRPWAVPWGAGRCNSSCTLAAFFAMRRAVSAASSRNRSPRCWPAMRARRHACAGGCWNWPVPAVRRWAHASRAGWDTSSAQTPSIATSARSRSSSPHRGSWELMSSRCDAAAPMALCLWISNAGSPLPCWRGAPPSP
jgi:hypothetical protein